MILSQKHCLSIQMHIGLENKICLKALEEITHRSSKVLIITPSTMLVGCLLDTITLLVGWLVGQSVESITLSVGWSVSL